MNKTLKQGRKACQIFGNYVKHSFVSYVNGLMETMDNRMALFANTTKYIKPNYAQVNNDDKHQKLGNQKGSV